MKHTISSTAGGKERREEGKRKEGRERGREGGGDWEWYVI
jgi:hypothetical protein